MARNELSALKGMRVMFADDDEQTADSMASILRMFFAEVMLARDGEQAWRSFKCKAPHVVLLDIDMPQMSGLQVAGKIRERDADIPIGILTGFDGKKELMAAVSLGLVDYLVKPVSTASLTTLLIRCTAQLNRRGRLHHVFQSGVVYYPATETVQGPDGEIVLSKNEKKFLRYMLARRGRIVELNDICRHLSNEDFEPLSIQGVRNLVHRLRGKIGKEAILSQKELGYQLS